MIHSSTISDNVVSGTSGDCGGISGGTGVTIFDSTMSGNSAVDAGGGAVVGIAQWFVLRRQVSRAGWWVLASIVGFVVASTVQFAVAVSLVAASVVVGAVYGAITGGVLVWLLRQPVTEEPSLPQEAA